MFVFKPPLASSYKAKRNETPLTQVALKIAFS